MALEGTLHDMSLSDLIQIFQMGPKSGVLSLLATAELGVIYVAAGRLVDAAVIRSPDRVVLSVHDDAVMRMLLWDEPASFTFRHDLSTQQRPVRIAHENEWLVIESMRRRDDLARVLPYHQLYAETCLQLTPLPPGGSSVSLDGNQWRVLSQVSHQHSLSTIATYTGLSYEQTVRTITELMALGIVEIAPTVRPAESLCKPKRPAHTGEAALPAFAGAGFTDRGALAKRPHVGRSLIGAIMRRVHSL